MRVEAFIIHLARAVQRRPQVDRLRQALLPMVSHVVDAVDGQTMGDDAVAAVYRRRLHRPFYPFDLRMGEIACFLSHRKAWREIVVRGLDAGLVAEDDVAVDGTIFPQACALAADAMRPGDFVRFPWRERGDDGKAVAEADGATLLAPELVGVGMQMQLVSRQAAEALLEATERFDRPVDTWIQLRRVPGGRVLAVRPVAISHLGDPGGGSTIQKAKKPLPEVVGREVRRAWYRMRVRAAARRP
jgi:GR25 family glycosyltransferase involved in LPS biosynthesis